MDNNNNKNQYDGYKTDAEREETAQHRMDDEIEVVSTPPRRSGSFFKYSGRVSLNTPENMDMKKGSSMKSTFAAFMAGALVVGSLMFASDKYNLFTGPQLAAAPQTSSVSGNNGAKTASLNNVVSSTKSVADIAKEAGPAVVKIETKVKSSKNGNSMYNDPFFQQFFGNQGRGSGKGSTQNQDDGALQSSGLGSGFIFQSSGYILTNEHVIDGADEIDVTVQGYDTPFKATLLGNSYDLDLAVLKIEGDKDFPTLPIGDSDNTQVGDWVVAIGNPYDFDYTVTSGVISAKERPISIPDDKGTREYKHLFQTDAAINPGNSGGPLLNMNGEVIGINTAVSSEAQGIGFAIPTSTISSVLENLKNNVEIPKEPSPYIGVSVANITEDMLGDLNLSSTKGAVVADIQPKTPAFEAGLREYDAIVAVDGAEISTADELTKKIQALKVGDKVKLTIVRNGNKQDITVTVGDRNAAQSTSKK
ncbi:Putative serine protease HtrA [Paenibacillus konkukensis]|uniref:Serine protease HtrA n=1 Tax=Paenibacillus konkukensis TaxID=2020716 RepID=A0ABY4RDZ0_9BACL|nr:trypsin-like peptidase domain-containing protein [Paenibacillus konkukensis]UQZ80971.1 Putative serine protease HtrA [Paenibacillus konkukensis]